MTARPAATLLILSDGKPGHLNQSLALARLCGLDYRIVPIHFRSRWLKLLSYLLDWLSLYLSGLLNIEEVGGTDFTAVVATGSETYYGAKLLARRLGIPALAIMLPRGYRYDFDFIIAQQHDRPPQRANILTLPVNLSYVDARGLFRADPAASYVAVVIGGPNRSYRMPVEEMRRTLDQIFSAFPAHRVVVATSRRTPVAIEGLLDNYPFEQQFIFSRNPDNPIPDFLLHCDVVFITADSTSMISEAVTVGQSRVEIIALPERRRGHKYARLIEHLETLGSVHRFCDGRPGAARRKVDLAQSLEAVGLCSLLNSKGARYCHE